MNILDVVVAVSLLPQGTFCYSLITTIILQIEQLSSTKANIIMISLVFVVVRLVNDFGFPYVLFGCLDKTPKVTYIPVVKTRFKLTNVAVIRHW